MPPLEQGPLDAALGEPGQGDADCKKTGELAGAHALRVDRPENEEVIQEYAVRKVAGEVIPARARARCKGMQQGDAEHQADQGFRVVGLLQGAVELEYAKGGSCGKGNQSNDGSGTGILLLVMVPLDQGAEQEKKQHAGQETVAIPVAVDEAAECAKIDAKTEQADDQKALGPYEQEGGDQVELDFRAEGPRGGDQGVAVGPVPHVIVEGNNEDVVDEIGSRWRMAQVVVFGLGVKLPGEGETEVGEVLREQAEGTVEIEGGRRGGLTVVAPDQAGHDVAGNEVEADDGDDAGIEAGNAEAGMAGGDGNGEDEAEGAEHGWAGLR